MALSQMSGSTATEVGRSLLFSPLALRGLTLKNRIAVSPMCEYSSQDGFANDWHLVHLGSRAVGGASLVIAEAAGVEARGRISPHDLGIYRDEHVEPLARVVRFCREQGAATGIQLAHAGRKASTHRPWNGGKPASPSEGGWEVVGPSSVPYDEGYPVPHALTTEEIAEVVEAFRQATRRSVAAGFDFIEIHGAHGYLIHQFNSPLSNRRTDAYGGSLSNRTRFAREVVTAVRSEWPDDRPLSMRVSATDWVDGGWDVEDTVQLARQLKELGVDLVDCSSGGSSPAPRIAPVATGGLQPGYQVAFAARIRESVGIATAAVGLITEPSHAEEILREGAADLIMIGRESLREPYWPLKAAQALGVEVDWPPQYLRAKPR